MRFGPSGNDIIFYEQGGKNTVQAMKWVSEMGLRAFEYSFTRGTNMSIEMARKIGEEAKKYDVLMSVHAPYYINLCKGVFDVEGEDFAKNYRWISKCVELVNAMGGNRVVVHLGSQGELERNEAIENTRHNLENIIKRLDERGLNDFLLCIETMGRFKLIGTHEEICQLCMVDARVIPTLDFGHINCVLQGELQREPGKIKEIVEYVEEKIGKEKLKKVHVHWSAIVYTDKGERVHTILDDEKWNFDFGAFAEIVRKKRLEPVIICESKNIMAQDAVKLLKWFKK